MKNNRTEEQGLRTEWGSSETHREAGVTGSSALSPQSSNRGFTLVELLIVICIISILAGIFFKRVLFYQEMAEKAAVQQVVGALQTALVLQFGHRLAENSGTADSGITTENPMDWLMQKPGNYVGELMQAKPETIEPGTWVFDKSVHELIYRPDHDTHFKSSLNEPNWIRYRTRLLYQPNYRNKKVMELAGVTITPVEPFQWLIKE